jgi:hypothetical protein
MVQINNSTHGSTVFAYVQALIEILVQVLQLGMVEIKNLPEKYGTCMCRICTVKLETYEHIQLTIVT